ncbi:MAG: histidine phosphatase family protein [Pseudomonadota bacterium]
MAHSLTLVRHGLIQANRDRVWHGSTDSALLPRGESQALRTGLEWARLEQAGEFQFSAVYVSPLQRCQRTAEFANAGRALAPLGIFSRAWVRYAPQRLARRASTGELLPIHTVSELTEWSIGDWEGMSFADLSSEHRFIDRSRHDLAYAPPQGEALGAVAERISRALHTIDSQHGPAERVLVVSHGAVMAVGLASILNDDPSLWIDYALANCSLTELSLSAPPELLSMNRSGHL